MLKWIKLGFLVTLFIALLTACDGTPSHPEVGTNWTLTRLTSAGQTLELDLSQPVTLAIGEKGQISGSAGCNSYGGEFKFKANGSLEAGPVEMTAMWCNSGMEVESAFGHALTVVTRYELSGNSLTLSSQEGQYLLVFTRSVE